MASSAKIGFRRCARSDAGAIAAILYRTGFLGSDLSGRGLFGDRRLFALVNTDYYVRYETANAFVAVDESAGGRVIGYIIGTADTRAYQAGFDRRMRWRIALRAILVSSWRYSESFRHVLAWSRQQGGDPGRFDDEFPAHLHINVLPEYQRLGIGEGLIRLFEDNMTARGVAGVHLGTSNRNVKALPFYRKMGYEVLSEEPGTFWIGVEGHVSVLFGKKLRSGREAG